LEAGRKEKESREEKKGEKGGPINTLPAYAAFTDKMLALRFYSDPVPGKKEKKEKVLKGEGEKKREKRFLPSFTSFCDELELRKRQKREARKIRFAARTSERALREGRKRKEGGGKKSPEEEEGKNRLPFFPVFFGREKEKQKPREKKGKDAEK